MNAPRTQDHPYENLVLPDFSNFITQPKNSTCIKIDSTRLMVEILGGMDQGPHHEFNQSDRSSKMLIEGQYVLVFRYRRETDGTYRPTCSIGLDTLPGGGIHIRQFQGSNDKRVSFRFSSSFKTQEYLLKLLEESFIKKGIPVTVEHNPTGIEGASDVDQALSKYRKLSEGIAILNAKHGTPTKRNRDGLQEAA